MFAALSENENCGCRREYIAGLLRLPSCASSCKSTWASPCGRTLYVHSSWNEFYNVPLKPSEMISLLLDLLGPEGTLVMPAFPIRQDPDKVFVDKAPVYTGLLCEVFAVGRT